METVMTSEETGFSASGDEAPVFEATHLTPLVAQLSQSITAANVVLREMESMQRREGRMRDTADSINARVRYFSYISVTVLLVVTYIQVTYLKRYFHKKKLL
jgi:heme exporter protein D